MAPPESERAARPTGGRLECLAKTPAKNGIDSGTPAPWRCNIILVPGGSSTSTTTPATPGTKAWPWLDLGPDGPVTQLASFLALRKIPTTTFAFKYTVPQSRQGITYETIQSLAHDLLDSFNEAQPGDDLADDLDEVDDYKEEEGQAEEEDEAKSDNGSQHASENESNTEDKSGPGDARSVDDNDVKATEGGEAMSRPNENAENAEDSDARKHEDVGGDTHPQEEKDPQDASATGDAEPHDYGQSLEDDKSVISDELPLPVGGVTVGVETPLEGNGAVDYARNAAHGTASEADTTGQDERPHERTSEDEHKQEDSTSLADDSSSKGTLITREGDNDKSQGDEDVPVDNEAAGNSDSQEREEPDDDDNGKADEEEESNHVPNYFIFVAQDLGGLIVKEALSVARKTIGSYQVFAACTTLLLFYETPCPSALHDSTWESLANWLLCTSRQGMLFSSAWIHNTAHMIESVCADFALSEPIYRILNVQCSAEDLAPFLRQDHLDRLPSTAALMSLGEEILKLKRTPFRYMSTLNTLALTLNGFPRHLSTTVISDAPRRARIAALRKEPGVSAWTSSSVSGGFSGFIVSSEDEASVLYEVLQKDASAANSSNSLRHLSTLDELSPIDQGLPENQQDIPSTPKTKPIAVISYVFDPYNRDANTDTAMLASLCYQLICMRRHSFAHTSELVYYLTFVSKERIWPFDKLLVLFRGLLSCPDEGVVACILWEMPSTLLPKGLVSTLAVLASGAESTFKLAVISSRVDVEFPSVPSTPVTPAKRHTFPSLLQPGRPLARAPTWATDEPHIFRLNYRCVDLSAVVDRELALLLGRRPAMKSVQEKLKDIILSRNAATISRSSRNDGHESDKALFSGSHADVVASVRAWLELITRRAVPISIASITREASQMPTNMAGLYAATLSYTPPAMIPVVQQLLAWLSLAKRPMTNAELAVALAVTHTPAAEQPGSVETLIHAKTMKDLDDHKPVNVQDDLLALLGSAVHSDSTGRPLLQAELIDLLQLDAVSSACPADIDEFPVTKYSLPDANNTLARICLTFLRICQRKDPHMTPTSIKRQPFLEYAILHWPYHYAEGCLLSPSAQSCFSYFDDASLMKFWAVLYHQLRHPGLTPPAENITLSMAADAGCLDLISRVLKYAPDKTYLESASEDKSSKEARIRSALSRALLYAVQQGDLDAVNLLKAAGAKSRYAVHVAVASKQNALLSQFGPLSDIVEVKDWRDHTPIQIAAITGNLEALEELLKSGTPTTDIPDSYEDEDDTDDYVHNIWDYDNKFYNPCYLPALNIACLFGHVDLVKRLLREDTINPNDLDAYYNRPLFYACLLQQADAMRALLDDPRTDPSLVVDMYYRRTPLQISTVLERDDMVELLLKKMHPRQPPNAITDEDALDPSPAFKNTLDDVLQISDRFTLTALHAAAFFGQVDAGKALLGHDSSGATTMLATKPQMAIPLHIAADHDHTEFMRLLLNAGNASEQLEAVRKDGNDQIALHITARYGNFASTMRLLVDAHVKAGVSLDIFDSGPRSALHYAALRGSAANARLLLDGGATPDVVDCDSATPLVLACRNSYIDVVRVLLGKKADTSLADETGVTPLLAAAWNGSVPIMKAILDTTTTKALQEADGQGKNALHFAVMSNSREAVAFVMQSMGQASRTSRTVHLTVEREDTLGDQILSDRGDLLLDSSGGSMPIEGAAENNMLSTLLPAVEQHIKDKSALYRTLLLRASSVGHLGNIKVLVDDYHADLDAVDKDGRTALSLAAENGHVSSVRYLARQTKPGKDKSGETPLSYAVSGGHTRVVDILLSNGHEAEVEMTNENNQSPLYLAVYRNNLDIVQLLLEHNADPNTPESDGDNTPLHCAVMFASLEVVSLIAKAPGVDGYARNKEGRTAMGVAAYYSAIGEARTLIDAGWKSKDRGSSRHSSPLHDAYDNEELIRLFVGEGGEDVNALDAKGRTALYLACQTPQGQVAVLLELGANPMIIDEEDHHTSLHAAAYFQDLATFRKMLNNKFVPSLAELKYIKSKAEDSIFDMAVSSGNTAILTYLLDAENSPFRVVEHGSNGAKALKNSIQKNLQDTTNLFLGRLNGIIDQLPDTVRRDQLKDLLEAVFQNTSSNVSDMESLAKQLIGYYTEPDHAGGDVGDGDDGGSGGMAGKEAWPYILVLGAIMGSDNMDMHEARSFPQLTQGFWAEIRDHIGWTYPQLLSTMGEHSSTTSSSSASEASNTLSAPDELPSTEKRLLDGLEEVVITDEDRDELKDRPTAPKLPTGWSALLSHSDIILSDKPFAAAKTDDKDGKTSEASAKEAAGDEADKEPARKVAEDEATKGEQAPMLFATCPPAEYGRYLVVADYPVPPNTQYYFSIRVVDAGEANIVGGGVGYSSAPKHRMPGWEAGSWAFHGDDGGYFHGTGLGMGHDKSGLYGTGDTLGVYVDTAAHKLFFAVNGKVLPRGFENVFGRVYPVVGLGHVASIEATFGSPDAFKDADGHAIMDQVTDWI